ncbi:MAG TPA: pitrilysin family protein [Pyrinomonadaceae bacterium]|nr:pitrilysin family protein [Pyrinomonadaceae bacterium]
MNKPFIFYKPFFVFAFLLIFSISNFAQTTISAAPQQEKLLNGLKVLTWRTPQADKVTVKIRIHSGAAFDPQGKEGLMNLLSENIFPNQAARDFFVEDLGGSFEIVNNYDYIQINTSGNSQEFLTILQTLANAINNITIDKETTLKLKAAQIEKIKENEKNPSFVADHAAAKRLLGTFPYGRPENGTLESLQKIDFADIIYAKDRFLTADNATIAVIGDVKSDYVMRAVKRYLGGWQKSENRVPSSFRQPDDADTKPLSIMIDGSENSAEIRFARRGLARNDKDFAASKIFTNILQNRLQSTSSKNSFVKNEEHILPGLLIFGYKSENNEKLLDITPLLTKEITNEEFVKAQTAVLDEFKAKNQADLWLDVDTFKLVSAGDEAKTFNNTTLADVQRVAQKLAKNPFVTVSVIQKTAESKTN